MVIFLDANALIYLLEAREPFAAQVRARMRNIAHACPNAGLALSRLSWLECRVGPLKAGDQALLRRYDSFFARPDLIWVDLNQSVIELATALRARHGLRTPDALQAASCLQLGDDHLMLTGDPAFNRVRQLNVALVG